MKTILVTGANRGIGQAIAQTLSEKGHRVIRTARSIPENCIDEIWVELDVADADSVRSMATQVAGMCGDEGLHVLINNAAVLLDSGMEMEDLSEELLESTLDVNLIGVLRVSNALFPLLKKSGEGHVINMSSQAANLEHPIKVSPAYGISKTALNGLTVQQALAWETYGIRVNCMSPGWVKTDMGGKDAPLAPREGADTAVWLATEAPGDVSGKFFSERTVIEW